MDFPKIIQEISAAVGVKPHRDKYRMWHHIPFIGKTAMVFDERAKGGGYASTPIEHYDNTSEMQKYAIEAIKHRAFSLGEGKPGRMNFVPWHKRIGKYPPGYFSHRVGIDVKE